MFNSKEIEALEKRIDYLEKKAEKLAISEIQLKAELIGRRIFERSALYGLNVSLKSKPAISLEELQTMQRRILDFIGAELKTTEAKTELVKKSGK